MAWIRTLLVQMAWRRLRHQSENALCKWFEGRTAGARGRIRRVMIVALAHKLLNALGRFSETGLVPTGVRLAWYRDRTDSVWPDAAGAGSGGE